MREERIQKKEIDGSRIGRRKVSWEKGRWEEC